MRDFLMTVLTLLAFVGLCVILGIVTRFTEHNKDNEDVFYTLLRGVGTLIALFAMVSMIAAIIGILILPFT